jgi:crossover junction endodeoxyribonuclease RuvC
VLFSCDLPTVTVTRADGRVRRKVDPVSLTMMIRDAKADASFVELVHASPGMGVGSAFNFGHSAGIIEAACALGGLPCHHVSPAAWKPAMGVPADKAQAMLRADAMLPSGSKHWPRKGDHGRAEAALIALYGWRSLTISNPEGNPPGRSVTAGVSAIPRVNKRSGAVTKATMARVAKQCGGSE